MGLGLMDLRAVEKRYENLSDLWSREAIKVVIFEDALRQETFNHLGRIQKYLRLNDLGLINLESSLAHLHWDLRGYVAPASEATLHWAKRLDEFNFQLAGAVHALDEDAKESARSLLRCISLLRDSDLKVNAALLSNLDGGRVLIVTEKDRDRKSVV